MLLRDMVLPLKAALERMVNVHKETGVNLRGFVVIKDKVTGRFVQFYTTPKTHQLAIDLPAQGLTSALDRAIAAQLLRFEKRSNAYQKAGLTPDLGAVLALRVMVEVHRLPPELAEVTIEEDVTGMKKGMN